MHTRHARSRTRKPTTPQVVTTMPSREWRVGPIVAPMPRTWKGWTALGFVGLSLLGSCENSWDAPTPTAPVATTVTQTIVPGETSQPTAPDAVVYPRARASASARAFITQHSTNTATTMATSQPTTATTNYAGSTWKSRSHEVYISISKAGVTTTRTTDCITTTAGQRSCTETTQTN